MAIKRERKEELVAEYVELLGRSQAIFVTDYRGLDVKKLDELRAEIRKAEGALRVTKNTLFSHALSQSGKPVPASLLDGQVATGFALNEAPALAKILIEFAKKEEQFSVRGGILGSEVLNAAQVQALANLPPLEQLRAQIIGLISAPAQNVTSAVANGIRQMLNVLDAYARTEAAA